jgi:hypothetical protein
VHALIVFSALVNVKALGDFRALQKGRRLGLGQREESRFVGLVEGTAKVFSSLAMVGRLNGGNSQIVQSGDYSDLYDSMIFLEKFGNHSGNKWCVGVAHC